MSAWMEALENWDRNRRGLVDELKALTPAYLDVAPAAGARTARQLAEHIYQASGMAMHGLETGERFVPGAGSPGPLPADADPADQLLRQWTEELKPRLERLAERADDTVETMMFGRQSRLSNLWFWISHEWYHRGQLATYVRFSGGVPALTQFILERQSAARRPD